MCIRDSSEPALYERDDSPDGFQWVDCSDHEGNVVSFVRRAADPNDTLLFVCNFAAVPRYGYGIGAPVGGVWVEILNSDATTYGGAGMGNFGAVETSPTPLHGRPHTLSLTLPPLSVIAFRAPRIVSPKIESEEATVAGDAGPLMPDQRGPAPRRR